MKFASKYTYFNQRKKEPEELEKKPGILRKEKKIKIDEDELFKTDVNVMTIGFAFLKEAQKNMGTGDAIFCSNCKSALNSFSRMLNKEEYLMRVQDLVKNKEPEEEKKVEIQKIEVLGKINQKFDELKPNERVWICEFCENQNKFMIEEEEIPKKDDIVYIIESKNQGLEKKTDLESDISIVLCVDNSGSMSITTEVQGKVNLKHGLTEEEYKMLKGFIEPGAEKFQYLPTQKKKNVSWVSRKQCVLGAIETQLNEMKLSHPNRKMGLVTFSNDVAIIGDGKGEPKFIAGDKLNKWQEIINLSLSCADTVMKEPLKSSSQTLLEQFNRLEEGGKTSLGPALLASVALASKGKKGSMVVICTDGLANVGLGSMDNPKDLDQSRQFYEKVSSFAQENNIVVSVITIKGEGCNVETLGKLADDTNGNVTRVNPDQISQDFSGILQDEVVATGVELEIRLHKGLKFCNEDGSNLSPDGSLLKRKIGNATINTEVAFQYEIKGEDELKQMNIDIEKALEVPFQAQIHYTSSEGHKFMRVITKIQKITKNRDLAEKNADVKILHFAAAQKSSNYAAIGEYEISRKFNKNWANYLQTSQNLNLNEENFKNNVEMQKKQKSLRSAIVKKEKKVEKALGIRKDSDSEDETKKKGNKSKDSDTEKKVLPVSKEKASKNSPPGKAKKMEAKKPQNPIPELLIKKMEKIPEKKSKLEAPKINFLLSKIPEKDEKEESKKVSKKKKPVRELSCSSGSEKMVDSEDEGATMIFKMKKGMK